MLEPSGRLRPPLNATPYGFPSQSLIKDNRLLNNLWNQALNPHSKAQWRPVAYFAAEETEA